MEIYMKRNLASSIAVFDIIKSLRYENILPRLSCPKYRFIALSWKNNLFICMHHYHLTTEGFT